MKATVQILIVSFFLILPLNLLAQVEPTDNNGNGFRNVSTLEHLRWISENPDSWGDNFELVNDIDASDTENWNDGAGWSPIGKSESHYSGTFEGNGFEINHLYINILESYGTGLFGYSSGNIKNLGLSNANITGVHGVGGLVGSNNGAIINCYSTGAIKGTETVGGLVGWNSMNNIIMNCYSTGEVSGKNWVGGLVGMNFDGTIRNCFSNAKVSGDLNVGGFIGENTGSVSCSFWDVETSGQETSAGGRGKTTAEMKNLSTYINAGWNFDFIWNIDDDYPYIDIDFSYRPTDTNGNGFLNISTLNHLRWLSETGYDLDKDWELDNNINAKETESWNCGEGWLPISNFSGTLDGNGFEIQNLYINRTNRDEFNNIGFFSESVGTIQNIGITNATIKGMEILGTLVGDNKGTISNCYSTGQLSSTRKFPEYFGVHGGLVGINSGIITDSYSKCKVSGDLVAGGLVGKNVGEIANSFSTEEVSGNDYLGGLVGLNEGDIISSYSTGAILFGGSGLGGGGGLVGENRGTIADSYSTGAVSGGGGGLVGMNQGPITDCYSTGAVSGGGGGLVGVNDYTITNCYSTGDVTGAEYAETVGGLIGTNSGEIINSYSTGGVAGNVSNYGCIQGGLIGINSGNITISYSTGNVTGIRGIIGGLIGENTGQVSNTFSRGDVSITQGIIGGLVGQNENGSISNSYSTGAVSGEEYVGGGLIGENAGTVGFSFWDVETSGLETSAGGIGKSTAEMKTKSTFTNVDWDFEVIWSINPDINDGYPFFLGKPTSVSEEQVVEQESYNFNVYPNPFAGSLNMEFDLPTEMPISIVLIDNSGKIVKHIRDGFGNAGRNNHIVELTELSTGLYFLILSANGEMLTQKVISVR